MTPYTRNNVKFTFHLVSVFAVTGMQIYRRCVMRATGNPSSGTQFIYTNAHEWGQLYEALYKYENR